MLLLNGLDELYLKLKSMRLYQRVAGQCLSAVRLALEIEDNDMALKVEVVGLQLIPGLS